MKKDVIVSHGVTYKLDRNGVLVQQDPQPFKYDPDYSAIYDRPEYTRDSEILQAMRFGFICGAHGRKIHSVLDIGFGNGAFMKYCRRSVMSVFGYDITGVKEVEGCRVVDTLVPADIYTMWDVLEHYHDLRFLKDLKCETLAISLPYCHFNQFGKEWFDTRYKHRKPNEHIRHFDEPGLIGTMSDYGWDCVSVSGHEDVVRKSGHGSQNILTAAFKR